MPLKAKAPSPQPTVKQSTKKWGAPLMAAGFSMTPNAIFLTQRDLGLKANDVNVLMHLIAHWWYADRLPFPSVAEIAYQMNVDRSTVQRCITSLVKRKLITRIIRKTPYGQTTNKYDLSGLIRKATPLAKKLLDEKKKKKETRKLRIAETENE
jgi:predicted transcriptional regulator